MIRTVVGLSIEKNAACADLIRIGIRLSDSHFKTDFEEFATSNRTVHPPGENDIYRRRVSTYSLVKSKPNMCLTIVDDRVLGSRPTAPSLQNKPSSRQRERERAVSTRKDNKYTSIRLDIMFVISVLLFNLHCVGYGVVSTTLQYRLCRIMRRHGAAFGVPGTVPCQCP